MGARVVQEAAGPGHHPGLQDVEDLPQQHEDADEEALGPMRDAVTIVRGVLGGGRFEYDGDTWSADVPPLLGEGPHAARVPPVYVAATAPKMQALAGEIGDGCPTPSITTPAFVRYTRENVKSDIDIGCTVVASIRDRPGRERAARERSPAYLANKVQNSGQCGHSPGPGGARAGRDQARRRGMMEQGGRLAAKAKVTDAILDKCKPIAGTPADCIAAIEEYKDAGCTHDMLELGGRSPQAGRLFGEQVLPHVRG
jgi:alkanesulfonate monooxygenase SsuD/methylene tetrahydromethanopterin reductase-like flavin-dependent oxidoreductase (luciferase family)